MSTTARDCAAVEELLADYLDGTLEPETLVRVKAHLASCDLCAELAREAAAGMQFLAQVSEPDVPPYLVNRILQNAPTRWSERLSQRDGARGWLNRLIAPVLQPRLVMGAMMTVLSLAMMTRCAGAPNRSLTATDLDPVKVWGALDDRLHRTWARTVKTYESMRLVYEVQSRLREWKQSESDPASADSAIESRKVNGTAPKTAEPAKETNTQ